MREPYLPRDGSLRLRRVLIEPGQSLRVRSKMHEGMLFLDGPSERTDIELGDRLEFLRSPEPLVLLGIDARRQRSGSMPG